MTMTETYWQACDATVRLVNTIKPTTAAQVVAILAENDPMGRSAGDAFWSAAGRGDDLLGLLLDAGWQGCWVEADYHWCVRHPVSGDHVGYVEGDVYARALMPLH